MMSDALLASFEDHIAELRARLPKLAGDLRRNALMELESSIEFLDLIATLREPGLRGGGEALGHGLQVQTPDAITSARPRRQEA
jgi:hypothetical protein